ncbi:MAG: multicopper oxidase domain-containing protein [Anaerolineae bacterium]
MKRVLSLKLLIFPIILLLVFSISRGQASGVTRTYYIAADEVDWDYAPNGDISMPGMEMMHEDSEVFIGHDEHHIGSVYRKAIYRQYTDETFTELVPREAQWEHLGLMGPIIRAEVGDTIVVVFRNNASHPYSIHPHGVLYEKDSEGAPYADGTEGADREDEAIPPGGTYTYTWEVVERSGPGPQDPSSVVWLYHSHTDEVRDTNSGLVGAIIVYSDGLLNDDGTVNGIDREFVTLFKVFNENVSWYLDENIAEFTEEPHEVEDEDDEFIESNLMHSINGYVYHNLPGLDMQLGDTVRWYVVALGTEVDLHSPHWHGITALWHGQRVDTVDLIPGMTQIVDFVADNPGTWMLHCHVDDHIIAGMSAVFTIHE